MKKTNHIQCMKKCEKHYSPSEGEKKAEEENEVACRYYIATASRRHKRGQWSDIGLMTSYADCGSYPMSWQSRALDPPTRTAYHMKYSVPDYDFLTIFHTWMRYESWWLVHFRVISQVKQSIHKPNNRLCFERKHYASYTPSRHLVLFGLTNFIDRGSLPGQARSSTT